MEAWIIKVLFSITNSFIGDLGAKLQTINIQSPGKWKTEKNKSIHIYTDPMACFELKRGKFWWMNSNRSEENKDDWVTGAGECLLINWSGMLSSETDWADEEGRNERQNLVTAAFCQIRWCIRWCSNKIPRETRMDVSISRGLFWFVWSDGASPK